MNRHKIGTQAGGVAGMQFVQDLISTHEEPKSTPVSYEQIGTDLNGMPIEAGLGSAVWSLYGMPQSDYDLLLNLQGDVPSAPMYVHTSKRNGASGIDFSNYLGMAGRPTFESREGLFVYGVKIPFTMLAPA